ncbi:hypothetical protein [Roseibium album]|uniref:hypothetical protein n=1 Tax=Roseibium album TaxID=311410 RepID=UPI00391B850C
MARFTFSRDFYIPKGAVKVTDKQSDAVVYLYTQKNTGLPCVAAFHGKAQKPDFKFWYPNEEQRDAKIECFFESRRNHLAHVSERRKAANKPHNLQVGHILRAMWGYDQTNIDYFQVTKLIGKTMVEIREIGQVSEGGWTGTCTPRLDDFQSEPMRRKVAHGRISVDNVRSAGLWDGTPDNWTAYA